MKIRAYFNKNFFQYKNKNSLNDIYTGAYHRERIIELSLKEILKYEYYKCLECRIENIYITILFIKIKITFREDY